MNFKELFEELKVPEHSYEQVEKQHIRYNHVEHECNVAVDNATLTGAL